MAWGKKGVNELEKLHKPQLIPGLVAKELVAKYKVPADLAALLRAVVRRHADVAGAYDIIIFDESDALARKVQVHDFNTFNDHPELILFEGWYNESSKTVEMQEKSKFVWDTPIFTEAQVLQKIEALSQPGSTAFFYIAAGASHGGPLGMGSVVIELNDQAAKKQKKYSIYFADVVDMQPVEKGQKLYDSDKAKEIAKWVVQGHHRRTY